LPDFREILYEDAQCYRNDCRTSKFLNFENGAEAIAARDGVIISTIGAVQRRMSNAMNQVYSDNFVDVERHYVLIGTSYCPLTLCPHDI